MLDVVIRGIAAWRLASMLVKDEGPGRVFVKLRNASGIETDTDGNFVFKTNAYTPLDCVFCTSVYTALLLLLVPKYIATWLAIAGTAAILEKQYGQS